MEIMEQVQYDLEAANKPKKIMEQVQYDLEAANKLKNILCSHQLSINNVSPEDIAKNKGIILNNKYYWLNNNLKLNVEVLAQALDIARRSVPRYWMYKKEHFTFETIEAAELLSVCWLDVNGSQNTMILSQCTEYEVLFDIKMNCGALGWSKPVNVSLTTPDGHVQECKVNLEPYIGKGYVEILVGKFANNGPRGCKHSVEFKMDETVNRNWKIGLVVRGVIIRAIN